MQKRLSKLFVKSKNLVIISHLLYRKKALHGAFENRTEIIGSAVFPTYALFNHSCDNNTYKYFVGNKLVVVASKVWGETFNFNSGYMVYF